MSNEIKVDGRTTRIIKKTQISITISEDNSNKIEELDIKNKSKFINWLLDNYYNGKDGVS